MKHKNQRLAFVGEYDRIFFGQPSQRILLHTRLKEYYRLKNVRCLEANIYIPQVEFGYGKQIHSLRPTKGKKILFYATIERHRTLILLKQPTKLKSITAQELAQLKKELNS